jgi:dTDP-4-dehydrorhamnose 3,5-epimerase
MLNGLVIITPVVRRDERGFFLESYQEARYKELGVNVQFCQDNHSYSAKDVIRGMHFQKGQAKLIYCPKGRIFDVAVDIRRDSPTFGQWEGVILDEQNHRQFFIPDGFAHGFCVLSKEAHVFYKVSSFYDPQVEKGFCFDDPKVAISWPILDPILSERDRNAKKLEEVV